jgi:hypothetical protein
LLGCKEFLGGRGEGMMEDWKNGKMEDWKSGRLEEGNDG